MNRRFFLIKMIGTAGVLGGCSSNGNDLSTTRESPDLTATGKRTITQSTQTGDTRKCINPERPEPQTGAGNVEPVQYPEMRPGFDNSSAMAEYIVSYEEAYRINLLINEHGDDLTDVQPGISNPRFFQLAQGSTIARVEYTYGYKKESLVVDSPTIYASYYINRNGIFRAEREGVLNDENVLEPDPTNEGHALECFGK